MGAVWRPVCVGVVAGFQRQDRPGAPSPIPWPEAVFKASKPGSICQPTPLERNPQQVGGDHVYPRAIPGLQHYQVGISDWRGSLVEGTQIGKQGREAHSKFMAWHSSTNQLTFHLCGQFPQILTFFFLSSLSFSL